MKRARAGHRGLGLIAALMILAFAAVMVATLTAVLARMIDGTSRHVQGVRARALAEAGVEAGLAGLGRPAAGGGDVTLRLEGGSCKVSVARTAARAVITSAGRLSLAGGEMTSTIIVEVALDGDGAPRILNRSERCEYSRHRSR